MSRSATALTHQQRMAQYAPTPPLDKMNPIQRYLHKGALEPWDWVRLALVVIAYILLRPSIEWLFKKYFDADPLKTSQEARQAAKARAKVSPNVIRGATAEAEQEDSLSPANATASGLETTANDEVSGRRGKGKSAFTAKTLEQQLLDWDDIQEIPPVEGPQGDVTEWVDRWDGGELST
jgi:Protein trafficking PGA2